MKRARYSVKPILHKPIYEALEEHKALFWTEHSIDLSKDKENISQLNDDEMRFIKYVLAFFAQSDGIVSENLAVRFKDDIMRFGKERDMDLTEARMFYSFQEAMEDIHAVTYSDQIEVYAKDESEKAVLFDAMGNLPVVAKKQDWGVKWLHSNDDFTKRLVAFAIIEGIYFSGSFCAIFWLKEYKKCKDTGQELLPGLCRANEYISRDEGLHCDFAALLYSYLGLEMSEKDFHAMLEEAVKVEKEFVTKALPVKLVGMSSEDMCRYIEFVSDKFCEKFGFNKLYNTPNPFDWMLKLMMSGKKDFFQKHATEYTIEDNRGAGDLSDLDFDSEDF